MSEHEDIFQEYYESQSRAERIAKWHDIDRDQLMVEYQMLKENYDKLLKTAARISKLGDKAQQKLLKYKDLMDTLRNLD
ncbi:MAG: hypothetical protein K9J12_01540 [Melioribacteraceae bacterium]|nr:hypothetical protein [Melioribacteraceae bacterium]MCF8266168.1 hypothetical protein [Melioribacteraceae bacterium]MCF8432399.1 hypothetical protein [Melioribacteraceae bacterium]